MNYNKIIKVLLFLFVILGSLLLVFMVNGTIELLIVKDKINDFKERGEYVTTIGNRNFYRVKPKYDYEDIDNRRVFNIYDEDNYIGSTGDIILTNRNPIRNVPIVSGFTGFFSYYFYAGHSTLNISDDGMILIEALGNTINENGVRYAINDWFYDSEDTPTILGLRVKNTNSESLKEVVNYAKSKIGYKYNMTFLFNRVNSFYCTDLISRSYLNAGININYDNLATTGNDMITSDETYLIFYRDIKYIDNEPIYNIYYLDKGE